MILQIHKFNHDTETQIAKVIEEAGEVLQSYLDDESVERQLSECLDTIQCTVNLMYMIADNQAVADALDKHFDKMIKRGYEIKHVLKIKL